MHEDSPDRPFLWSEIHDLAEKKLAELDQAIRAEIGKPVNPVPARGGERHRFLVLLGERADDWAARGAKTYKDCLAQIGRADAPGAIHAVWLNGLRFFLTENLTVLLRLACGFGSREQELLGFYSRKYPTPDDVIEVRTNAHEIQRIVDRISKQYQNQALRPNGGLEQSTRTIDESKRQNPQLASVSQPIIAPVPTAPTSGIPEGLAAGRSKPETSPVVMQPSDDSPGKSDSATKEASATSARPAQITLKNRTTRSKPPCYEVAASIIKNNPHITSRVFCKAMDDRAAKNPQSLKFRPPDRWHVQTFFDMYKKRKNTVDAFLSRLRKEISTPTPR